MGLNQFTGSPWHIERWHSDDEKRRHRSNCIYFRKDDHYCKCNRIPCYGSAHCTDYKEHNDDIQSKPTVNNKDKIKSASSDVISQAKKHLPIGTNVRHKRFGEGIVVSYEDEYVVIHFYDFGEKKRLRIQDCIKDNNLVKRD